MKLPVILTNSRRDLWYKISSWFNPRQKWLTKVIPNIWCDKVELVPLLLFTVLIDFVEQEKGLDQLDVDWSEDLRAGYVIQEYVDDIQTKYGLLRQVYAYVKTDRKIFHDRMNEAYPSELPTFITNGNSTSEEPYATKYREVIRLRKLIEEKDQWAMKAIVEHVGVLWT